jgi:hypothetical protein
VRVDIPPQREGKAGFTLIADVHEEEVWGAAPVWHIQYSKGALCSVGIV